MRLAATVVSLALAACSARATAPAHHPEPPAPRVPGLRLPGGVTPLAYALRLDVDPDRDAFSGEVQIRVRIDGPTDRVWLSAKDLTIQRARDDDGPLALLPERGDQMIALGLPRAVAHRTLTLDLAYTGRADGDEEGLFRERSGDRAYLFSQAEAVYARRIVPCFDEPQFKTPWRVTIDAPAGDVVLGNMPVAHDTLLSGGRREVAFAETPAMPSYLLAIAVGPFELVDAGRVGRGRVPVRIAALAGEGAAARPFAAQLPAIVDAAERFTGDALPWPKLDLVAVPHLFGAMENPGLFTFDRSYLGGDPDEPDPVRRFVFVAAHEVAHLWFGDLVTPAWWDDLWLAEGFASWLGGRVAAEVAPPPDPVLDVALARERALAADAGPDEHPLRRRVTSNADPDASFDAIAYDKGPAVIATFARWIGEDRFRDALRGFLRAHRGGTATAADLEAALAGTSSRAVARAFDGYLDHAGAPVVDVALRCTGAPVAVAHARGGLTIPVCVRYPGAHGAATTCALVGAHAELALREAASCPAWLVGNAGAAYYEVAGPAPPAAALTPAERIALGDDVAAAIGRGELRATDALHALRDLARAHDGYAAYAALAIAGAIDPLVDDAARPAWHGWLAAAFADRTGEAAMIAPRTPVDRAVRDQLAPLVAPELDGAVVRAAREALDAELADDTAEPALVAIAAPAGDRALFDRVGRAVLQGDVELADALGDFPPALIDPIADAAAHGGMARPVAFGALTAYLARPDTRTAAWRAMHARLAAMLDRVPAGGLVALVEATRHLCDPAARREVEADFGGRVAGVAGGGRALAQSLADIDRCIAARAKLGDVGAALAEVHGAP